MATWHRFGQDVDDEGNPIVDIEIFRWTDVKPGDVVQSRGTLAYRQRDFIGRDEETKVTKLHSAPVLVLARIPGIPGEDAPDSGIVTFVCLSRHGLLLILQHPDLGK